MLPLAFERAAKNSFVNPKFDSQVLEEQYQTSIFPQIRLRFRWVVSLYIKIFIISKWKWGIILSCLLMDKLMRRLLCTYSLQSGSSCRFPSFYMLSLKWNFSFSFKFKFIPYNNILYWMIPLTMPPQRLYWNSREEKLSTSSSLMLIMQFYHSLWYNFSMWYLKKIFFVFLDERKKKVEFYLPFKN